ncbi:GntR family transcriptional regulator [Longimicrobium sp.]|uniref:GntR family transcriptional regulator n=1 Tax=Longimicrobium sp. TaxID=2029185 RepID=UPI002C2BB0D7|nr:Clp protease N-terminal domain-containing protein [Longimicrobium sp.]HSU13312.1 Clp protease N-terminal domain-containing protein [Longimicrobium sp.]
MVFGWRSQGRREPQMQAGHYTFGEDVRLALANAREEAAELRHPQVGTEHILLGLLRDSGCEAVRLLGMVGVNPEKLWRYVRDAAPARPGNAPVRSELPYTAGAKRVLELAVDEARMGDTAEITQRHLLAGVLGEETGIGARALATFGLTPEALRATRPASSPPGMAIHVDDASDKSIYEQIVGQVQEAVATGRAKPGERLPSVRGLADELDVAPGTVARAYAELERLGVVVTDGARGTRIAERSAAVPARIDDLAGLIRPVVVAAYHQGASAADLRAALDRAMSGIYPADSGAAEE